MLAAVLNSLFEYFINTIEAVLAQAKKSGSYDLGILDVGAVGETIKSIDSSELLFKYVRIGIAEISWKKYDGNKVLEKQDP